MITGDANITFGIGPGEFTRTLSVGETDMFVYRTVHESDGDAEEVIETISNASGDVIATSVGELSLCKAWEALVWPIIEGSQ